MARGPMFREVVGGEVVQKVRMTAAELTEHEKHKGAVPYDAREEKIATLESRIAELEK